MTSRKPLSIGQQYTVGYDGSLEHTQDSGHTVRLQPLRAPDQRVHCVAVLGESLEPVEHAYLSAREIWIYSWGFDVPPPWERGEGLAPEPAPKTGANADTRMRYTIAPGSQVWVETDAQPGGAAQVLVWHDGTGWTYVAYGRHAKDVSQVLHRAQAAARRVHNAVTGAPAKRAPRRQGSDPSEDLVWHRSDSGQWTATAGGDPCDAHTAVWYEAGEWHWRSGERRGTSDEPGRARCAASLSAYMAAHGTTRPKKPTTR